MDPAVLQKHQNDFVKIVDKCISAWEDTLTVMPEYKGVPSMFEAEKTPVIPAGRPSKVLVKSHEQLNIAAKLANLSTRVLLVTPGCNTNRGGGVQSGGQSFEADICRRSNYWNALRKVPRDAWPRKPGMMILFPGVCVFKDENCQPCKPYSVDVLSVVMPRSPGEIIVEGAAMYEKDSDRDMTRRCISTIMKLGIGYDTVVLNRICMNPTPHPIDDYIQILQEFLPKSGVQVVWVLANSGTTTGNGKSARFTYKKLCKRVHNVSVDHSDCDSPEDEYDDKRPDQINQVDSDNESKFIRRTDILKQMLQEAQDNAAAQ